MKNLMKSLLIGYLMIVTSFSLTIYAAPQTNLRFMWWGGETRHKATMDAITQYMKENPNIKINGEYQGFDGYYQKLLTQLAGGTAADIIQIDQPWVADLMAQGDLFLNLNTSKEIDLTTFDKNILQSQCQWQGKLIGLPTGLNGLIYVANQDFLRKYNLSPNLKLDWDNLIKIGTQIHSQNKQAYLLDMDLTQVVQMIMMHVKQHTGIDQWVSDNFQPGFDKTGLTQAFAYYRRLLDSGTLVPLENSILFNLKPEQNPQWNNGNIGINQTYVSAIAQFYLNDKLKLDVLLPPILKTAENTGLVVRPSQLLVINKKSPRAKEAAKFMNWFFNNPDAILSLKTERGIPPTKAGMDILEKNNLLDPNMSKGIKLAIENAGKAEHALTTNKELMTIFEETIQKVGFGKVTPEKAAEQMVRDYQNKLAVLKRQLKQI